ncbi:MAG TPA: tetratricopeptide repeat protein [Polyangiaceae bacterium]
MAERKVIPIAEGIERRRQEKARKSRDDLADAFEAAADDPDAPANFTLLGNMSFIEGAHEEAVAAYSRALSLAPDEANALKGRGRAYVQLGELDRALPDLDAALEAFPDEAMLHYYRGYCLSRRGEARREQGIDDSETDGEARARNTAALASLERAFELGLRHPDLYHELAYAQEGVGDPDAFLAMLDRVVAALPDDLPLRAVHEDQHRRRRSTSRAATDANERVDRGETR